MTNNSKCVCVQRGNFVDMTNCLIHGHTPEEKVAPNSLIVSLAEDIKSGLTPSSWEKVTRVEIIDHSLPVSEGGGRCYVKWDKDVKVEESLQDGGRTLKIFISKK